MRQKPSENQGIWINFLKNILTKYDKSEILIVFFKKCAIIFLSLLFTIKKQLPFPFRIAFCEIFVIGVYR